MKQFKLEEYTPKEYYSSAGELDKEIVVLEENEPDKRTKLWNVWKSNLNDLYLKYNFIVKFKCYKQI